MESEINRLVEAWRVCFSASAAQKANPSVYQEAIGYLEQFKVIKFSFICTVTFKQQMQHKNLALKIETGFVLISFFIIYC